MLLTMCVMQQAAMAGHPASGVPGGLPGARAEAGPDRRCAASEEAQGGQAAQGRLGAAEQVADRAEEAGEPGLSLCRLSGVILNPGTLDLEAMVSPGIGWCMSPAAHYGPACSKSHMRSKVCAQHKPG